MTAALVQMEVLLARAEPKPCMLPLERTALVIIDMQKEFLDERGFAATLGNDVSKASEIVPACQSVLASWRKLGGAVVHTLEAHEPDLSDCAPSKRTGPRAAPKGKRIGDTMNPEMGRILIRGEPGNAIVDELKPIPGEKVLHKPGKGSFYHTDLDEHLRGKGITHLIFAGVSTEVCVQTTMREANDRGYECILLEDCTASYFPEFKASVIKQISAQGGIVGWTATSDELLSCLHTVMLSVPQAKPNPCVLPLERTALVIIDMQKEFLDERGFAATLGNDVSKASEIVPACQSVLASWRKLGGAVVHTLEAHEPDLSDCAPSKRTGPRAAPKGKRIGDTMNPEMGRILIRGEPGNAIVDELKPIPGEKVLHKPGKGSFYHTDLDEHLRGKGITHLIFAGVSTEVCVQTTMREANDRGYECILLEDCTASYFPEFKASVIKQISAQGGIVGWTATSEDLLLALCQNQASCRGGA
eukprot:TRINITY_DN2422_c0_g1_i1.p1 TRINITY_DN2422_c0_g1~~TRINITY_DN2422_c0_g1_i1.p1  ORF type:complete len:473 (-),score=94.91 TRINITY_DN2422_c0_g1_i1:326-1744(-)